MVVVQRNEVRATRFVLFLTIILSVITLISIVLGFSGASQAVSLG